MVEQGVLTMETRALQSQGVSTESLDLTNRCMIEDLLALFPARLPGGRAQEGPDEHVKMKEQLAMIARSKSNLMHDLARAKRNVEELTIKLNGVNGSCITDKAHTLETDAAAFLEKEGWQVELDAMKQQYESALLELQTTKQAMESLKHELMVCVEAKDEAVRLAGEAMSAAESTARRVEELSAELFTTRGSYTTAGMEDLIDELPGAMETTLLEMPTEMTKQEVLLSAFEESEGRCKKASTSEDKVEAYQALPMQCQNHQKADDHSLSLALKALQKDLAAAKDAEKKAVDAQMIMQADLESANLEAERAKSAESTVKVSLSKVSKELEDAQEELVKTSIEGAALAASLESFKAKFENSREEAREASDREAIAKRKVTELLESIEKMKESYQAELSMCKEEEASARAIIESLQIDLEKLKSESELAAEKELRAAAKISEMIKEIERSRTELMEHQEHSSNEILALSTKLEENQARLLTFEEMESSNATKIAALMTALDNKQIDVDHLQHRLIEMESNNISRVAALMSDIDKKQAEVNDLQRRLSEMESNAEAMGAELSHLNKSSQELAELRAKEQEGNARITALDAELLDLKQALKLALDSGAAERDRSQKLEIALQTSMSQREEVKCELEAARHEIDLEKQVKEDLMAQMKAAAENAEKTLNEERAAYNAAATKALLDCQLAREEANKARQENDAAESKLRSALEDVERTRIELEKLREEAQSARVDADQIRATLEIQKSRANAAEDEAKKVLGEVAHLRTELTEAKEIAMHTVAAKDAAEHGFQDAIEQLEAQKLRGKEEELANHTLREEIMSLKEKLSLHEEQLKISKYEVDSLQSSKTELLKELEDAKAETEASKRALIDVQQLVVDMEKAKRIMESDIQRLLDDSKLWRTPIDSRDIMPLSEVTALNIDVMGDSRDEKPQPDSPDSESVQSFNATYPHFSPDKREEEMTADKEDENEAHTGNVPARSGKKKKKALLTRFQSYLDKRKTSS
ncbi:hypothetical protein KP509_04G073500 [Ceratopteris richardii]|uniref:Uncharacterized protein n=1 Tax=Ceratopteris richardii TaxID=49495 RepID=A0A8T2UYB5_CERRI|nr:hypothetical protein KP509_04G073500 [Ceratopteris richardii]